MKCVKASKSTYQKDVPLYTAIFVVSTVIYTRGKQCISVLVCIGGVYFIYSSYQQLQLHDPYKVSDQIYNRVV